MLAVYDVCRLGKTDNKYLEIMSSVLDADKYDLYSVDKALFVPLDQVYDLMTRQPDPDTVSRQKMINTVNNLRTRCDNDIDAYHDLMVSAIEALPPSPTSSRPHGQWIFKPNIYGVAYCSRCDYELHTNDTNFCPHCGADMRQNGGAV